MELNRKSGILLHISSLPTEFGIGDLGNEAFSFVDQIVRHGFKVWQILPLNPNGPGNSPYQAYSAYAGDKLYISPVSLFEWGLVAETSIKRKPLFNRLTIDFEKVTKWKQILLTEAWDNFKTLADTNLENEFNAFLNEHSWWLNDYALYAALKKEFNDLPWNKWDKDIASRSSAALEKYNSILKEEIEFQKFIQFLFIRQWFQLKNYANEQGIEIFGDLPLYVSHDSADVWGNQGLFLLDNEGEPTKLGGVPPDYFSDDGQLWGNPVYDWENLKNTNYQWWIARLYYNFHLFNIVRIDHFRGLESFWAIPAGAENAKVGEWLPAKGYELLDILRQRLGKLPIIAEDLGLITPEVHQLRDEFKLPGMKVLQFAFASDFTNEHLTHNFIGRNVVYTGTHDNDTLLSWFNSLDKTEKKMVLKFIGHKKGQSTKRLIELVWASSAELAIIPMQDVLGIGNSGRMNVPGTATGNWRWRYQKRQLKKSFLQYFENLNKIYNR